MELIRLWVWLVESEIATDEELKLITGINGYSMETLNSVLYYRTGYHSREEMEGEEIHEKK